MASPMILVNALKFLRAAPLILAFALAHPGTVLGDECRMRAPAKEPEVTFALQSSPTTWHFGHTRDQIRALRANSGAKLAAVGPNWQSIGLTLATFVLAVDVRVVAMPVKASIIYRGRFDVPSRGPRARRHQRVARFPVGRAALEWWHGAA